MPWEQDGRKWHVETRTARNGQPCRWEGRILAEIEKRIHELGQFSETNVLTAAALLPVAIVSTFAGVWLVRRIDGERFYKIIYWLMILVGVILLFEAAL